MLLELSGILVSLVVLVAVFFYWSHKKEYELVKHLPGPQPGPFLGNAAMFMGISEEQQVTIWHQLAKEYGPVYRISVPFKPPAVFLADPRDVSHVLHKNFDNYIKGPDLQAVFTDLAGKGIFNVNGDEWYSQRKTALKIFKVRTMRSYYDTISAHCHTLVGVLTRAAQSGKVIDFQQLMYCFTFDTICKIAFGYDAKTMESEEAGTGSRFQNSFNAAQSMVENRSRSVTFMLTRHMSAADRQHLDFLNSTCADIIAQRRHKIESGEQFDAEDLLSQYMMTHDFDDQYLRDMILNFMLAGRDTTATTLAWMVYQLATHPAIERQLLDEFLAFDLDKQFPDFELLKRGDLKFNRYVQDETLRLYSPVPYDPKFCLKDDQLPSGATIKAGTTVVWSAYLTGRLPQFWGTEDTETFDPNRWRPENVAKIHPSLLPFDFPFQLGPRACLGIQLARLEMAAVMATILPRFSFEPKKTAAPAKSITLCVLDGLPMQVHLRS